MRTAIILLIILCILIVGIGIAFCCIDAPKSAKTPSEALDDTNDLDTIDAVVTWVDGRSKERYRLLDEYMQKEQEEYPDADILHLKAREPDVRGPPEQDELYFCLHLMAKFMPWLRQVHLITQKPERPSWLSPTSNSVNGLKIQIVHHDDIFDIKGPKIPTFNSTSILTNIPNIPNLAERFILFDDDCYVGQPLSPSHFFDVDGTPIVPVNVCNIDNFRGEPAWFRTIQHSHELIRKYLTKRSITMPEIILAPEHVCVPFLKSAFRHILYEDEDINKARCNLLRFRCNREFYTQAVIIGILATLGAIQTPKPDFQARMLQTDQLRYFTAETMPHVFCINHALSETDVSILNSLVASNGLVPYAHSTMVPCA